MEKKILVSVISVITNVILSLGKIFIGLISKSSAILADGINSGTDIISSLISFIGIKAAEKPGDKKHPYGYGKAELVSGLLITVIIFISALYIIYEAIQGFFTQSQVKITLIAFTIMGFSTLINGIMSYVKVYYGKKYNSPSLISDGMHSKIDLLVSLTIFAGLFFVRFYGKIDSAIALVVGLYILKESINLGKETTDSLIGVSASEEIENKIKEIVKKNNIRLKELKTQKFGNKTFAEIEINLPSRVKVEKAVDFTNKLKKQLKEKIEELEYISIKIASLNIRTGYYLPGFGKGFRWEKQEKSNEQGKGPTGNCICDKCGYKIKHQRGKPCSELKCPKCKINLKRE